MRKRGDRLSILYLCDYQAPYGGNFIASMTRLDAALTARGAKTLYVFPAGAAKRDWYKAMQAREMRLLPLADGGMSERARQLVRLIDENSVTVLHTHFGLFALSELVALLCPGLRLILHFHSDFSAGRRPTRKDRLRDMLKRIPEWFIGKRRLTKISVSEGSARTTRDCVCLHNALVEERFTDALWTREQTRNAFCVPEAATLVLVFGWSPLIKGVDVAVQAVERIIANGRDDFVLGIVCGREYTAERMRTFIREHTGCSGDEPWLRLLPPEEDVFRYHKAADIMLSTSRSETFSYALLEAIAAGRLCAASDIPGVQWAKGFDTVAYFPSGDEAALAETLLRLDGARRTEACDECLAAASARAKREYAIEDWVEGMLAVYETN